MSRRTLARKAHQGPASRVIPYKGAPMMTVSDEFTVWRL